MAVAEAFGVMPIAAKKAFLTTVTISKNASDTFAAIPDANNGAMVGCCGGGCHWLR